MGNAAIEIQFSRNSVKASMYAQELQFAASSEKLCTHMTIMRN